MTYVPVPDPEYGQHVCRRAVRLTNVEGATIGELEDSVHAIRCRIEHDGEKVTGVEAEFVRQPMTTCAGAMGQLQLLVGTPLSTPLAEFYADGKARIHCTHSYDLAWWSIAHANRAEAVRRYDSIVPDHPKGREIEATLLVNGAPMLNWRVCDDTILAPGPFAGRHAMKGFVGWAVENLTGDMLEAALVLNKGYFTSQSHYFLQRPGTMGEIAQAFANTCWTYMSPRLEATEQVPSRRNFDDGVGLLEFQR
jgi:hypothetical protein